MADAGIKTDWASEEDYWRTNYKRQPYIESGRDFEFYSPAYRFGFDAAERYPDETWNDVEPDLRREWDRYEDRGESTWDQMKSAVRDAWDRVMGR